MKIFITGISTDVGKTIAAAIITESLQADYWKPVQAGDLDNSDTAKVRALVSNSKSIFHPNSYALNTPASPHLAAAVDGVTIDLSQIREPETSNHLVIEGAGGILVPLNDQQTVADLIQPDHNVILVSRHYLGSINHTMLSIAWLKQRGIQIAGIIFNGAEHPSTEKFILDNSGMKVIGRIEPEPYFDRNVISEYASLFYDNLQSL